MIIGKKRLRASSQSREIERGGDEIQRASEDFFDIQKKVSWPLRILFVVTMPFVRTFAIMSLPDEIREHYDLKLTRTTQVLNSCVGFMMCKVYPHWPKSLRRLPYRHISRRAELRRESGKMQPTLRMPPVYALGGCQVDKDRPVFPTLTRP